MNLPFLKKIPFLKEKKEEKEYFLSLIIKPFSINAILFEGIDTQLAIVATRETDLNKDSSEIGEEELIEATDEVVSFVEGKIQGEAQLDKTIFALPYDWVSEGKIKKEYLLRLKKLCQELGLTPVGFIVSIEAIVHHIQNQEGAPISSIFVETSKEKVIIYLVRAGKILETHSKEIENENLLEAVEYLLRKIEKMDILPSKITLLSYNGTKNMQQEFLAHTWSDEISFIHVPQVTVLEKGFENEAIINGVASQMDLQLTDEKTIDKKEEILREEEDLAQDFGFVQEEDLALSQEEESNSFEDEKGQAIQGFAKHGEKQTQDNFEEFSQREKKTEFGKKNFSQLLSVLNFSTISTKFKNFNKKDLLNFRNSQTKIKFLAAIIFIGLFAFVLSFLYYSFILKADIILALEKSVIDRSIDIELSPNSNNTASSMKLNLVSEDIEGRDTANATGTEEIGDKAAGEVTIYNKTDSSRTFSKETVITGPSNLEFVLLSDVTIASTSAFSTGTPSNAKVKIEAGDIGKEYNLPSDTNFLIEAFSASDYFAKNDNAFGGGDKKEARVVSEEDMNSLLIFLRESLLTKAKENAARNLKNDDILLEDPIAIEILEQNFDKKEGEEAENVTLSATIRYKMGYYTKKDLEEVIKAVSEEDIPENFTLRLSESNIEVEDLTIESNDTAQASIKINAVYTPNINEGDIKDKIKGRSESFTIQTISNMEGVTSVEVNFRNRLPFFPKLLPREIKNIIIVSET